MNITLFVSMLFSLQLIYWGLAKRACRNMEGSADYFLAGKSVKLFPLAMTFLASQVGGGVVLGSAEEAYRFGWPVLLFPLGSALGLILLGCGIGRKLAEFKVATIAEIMEVTYGSARLKKLASCLSIASLFLILVAQVIASRKFLISLGIASSPLFILFWASVVLYTAQGGLKALISTDLAQAIFFSFVFFLCLSFTLGRDPTLIPLGFTQKEMLPIASKLWGWLLMPLLFMVIEQDMGQRCFAAGSPQAVSKATLMAGVGTMLISVVPIFFGCLAKNLGLQIPQGGSVLMTAIGNLTGPWITSLVGCAVLAAIISTATSLINAISSNIASDFNLPFLSKTGSIKGLKGLSALVAMGALILAFYCNNIVDLLVLSYELSVGCLFVPISFALLRKKGPLLAAWLAIIVGAASYAFPYLSFGFPREVASVLLSLAGYACGEFISQIIKIKENLS